MAASIEKTYEGQWSSDPALLKSLLGKGFTIIAHDKRDECLVKINWTGFEYRATSSDWNYPVSEDLSYWTFLVPFPLPALEPKPLEWIHADPDLDGTSWQLTASDGFLMYSVWKSGTWEIYYGGYVAVAICSGVVSGGMESAKAAIHEWRVNHLKSMIV